MKTHPGHAKGFMMLSLLGLVWGLTGCAPTDHLLYPGAMKPPSSDALILLDPGLRMVKFDGQDVAIQFLSSDDRFHVLPGQHVLTIRRYTNTTYNEDSPIGKLMAELNKDKEVKVDAAAGRSYKVTSQSMQVKANNSELGDAWLVSIEPLP